MISKRYIIVYNDNGSKRWYDYDNLSTIAQMLIELPYLSNHIIIDTVENKIIDL